jgi:hypothetical protein
MVPDTFSPDLERFALPANLSGTISPNVRNVTQLTVFVLDISRVSGSIPVELFDLPDINTIALSSASTAPLSGTVPNTLVNAPNVTSLRLDRSKVSGTLPSYLEQAPELENAYFTDSDISGTLPEFNSSNKIFDIAFKGISVSGTLPKSYKRFATNCVTIWVYETPVSPPHGMHSPYESQRLALTSSTANECNNCASLTACGCGAGEWHPTK